MYSTRINGEVTTLGTSGLLYRSNKVMYDRATNSLWNQLIGEPVIGPLADSGIKLEVFPVALTTWGEWLTDHPDTTVLSLDTGVYPERSYRSEDNRLSIYFDYRADSGTMFPIWQRDDRLATKSEVLGVSVGDAHKGYAVEDLNQARLIEDTVGGLPLVIVASGESSRAQVYVNESSHEFSIPGDAGLSGFPGSLVDADGDVWDVTDDSLVNTSDTTETLRRYPTQISFWFGWFAFHPDTLLYGE